MALFPRDVRLRTAVDSGLGTRDSYLGATSSCVCSGIEFRAMCTYWFGHTPNASVNNAATKTATPTLKSNAGPGAASFSPSAGASTGSPAAPAPPAPPP